MAALPLSAIPIRLTAEHVVASAALPAGAAPWRLVAIDILATGTPSGRRLRDPDQRPVLEQLVRQTRTPSRSTRAEWAAQLSFANSGSMPYDTTASSITVGLGNLGNGRGGMRIIPSTDVRRTHVCCAGSSADFGHEAARDHLDLAEGSALQFTLDSAPRYPVLSRELSR